MANEEAKNDQKQAEQVEEKSSPEKVAAGGFTLFSWLILGAVVVAGSTGGFALSQLFGGQEPAVIQASEQSVPKNDNIDSILAKEKGQNTWIEELEPVLANLDEPGVTRYVRVTVTLEISPELDEVKGREFLEGKKMLLRDWMTTYFAGLTLEDVRGTRNLGRIKREVVDQFNELLFPDSSPFIERVLFKEFAVQ
jgi:flagellar basal body-associated protein FliL